MAMDASVAREVASNPWSKILYFDDSKTVLLKWLPASKDMSDDQVKESVQLFADAGKDLRPHYMLIDITEFGRSFTDEINKWRDANIIPIYNASGFRKMAFLVPIEFPYSFEKGAEPANEPLATFPTGWFSNRDNLDQWLRS